MLFFFFTFLGFVFYSSDSSTGLCVLIEEVSAFSLLTAEGTEMVKSVTPRLVQGNTQCIDQDSNLHCYCHKSTA